MRALASHQCVSGSNHGSGVICWLCLLLVICSAPRGFSPGTPLKNERSLNRLVGIKVWFFFLFSMYIKLFFNVMSTVPRKNQSIDFLYCKYVICLPTEPQGVHKNSLRTRSEMPVHSSIELEFENVGFCEEGKTGVPREKPLGAEQGTNNKHNQHTTPDPWFEPETHWWEVSALTTAPSMLQHLYFPSLKTHSKKKFST